MPGTTQSHTPVRAVHVPQRRSRRTALRTGAAVAAGLVVVTAVSASAANLGPVTTPTLGATTAVIGSCDVDGVTVSYANAYLPANGQYNVSTLSVTNIAPACSGLTMSITLTGAANAGLVTLAPVAVASTSALNLPVSAVTPTPTALVTGIAVVIAA